MARRSGGWNKYVVVDRKILRGKPVIKGTRVAVQVILGSLAAGMSVADVCEQYRLKPAQVRAGLAYAAEVLAEESVYALAR